MAWAQSFGQLRIKGGEGFGILGLKSPAGDGLGQFSSHEMPRSPSTLLLKETPRRGGEVDIPFFRTSCLSLGSRSLGGSGAVGKGHGWAWN